MMDVFDSPDVSNESDDFMGMEFDPGVETALGNYDTSAWVSTFIGNHTLPYKPLAFTMTIVLGWGFLFYLLEEQWGFDTRQITDNIGIAPTALSVLGSTVGFVLCVRINSANGQWWEGRGQFGKAVSNSVDITGMFCAAYTVDTDGYVQKFVGTHALAFVVSLKNLLCFEPSEETEDEDDARELRQFMTSVDYEFLMSASAKYRPHLILQLLRAAISQAAVEEKLPRRTAQALLDTVSNMTDAYYGCVKVHYKV